MVQSSKRDRSDNDAPGNNDVRYLYCNQLGSTKSAPGAPRVSKGEKVDDDAFIAFEKRLYHRRQPEVLLRTGEVSQTNWQR